MTNLNIPKHWQVKKLGESTINYDGKRIPLSKEVRSKRQGEYRYYGATEIVDYINDYIFDGSFLLIGEDGANLLSRSKSLAFIVSGKFWVNNHAHVLQTKDFLDLKFLSYYFNSINLSQFVSGSAQPKLNQANLNKIEIPIPPLPEQHQIVSKIEELLSDLDNGKQQLLTAQQQLKVYRQSLLKCAFEGKLTNKNVKEGELPKGWKWLTLGEVCKKIGDIDHKMPKQLPSGYPYVSTKDFTDDLKISFQNAKFISKEDFLNLSRKIKPEKGDIIFPRYGTIGKNILVDFNKDFLVSYSCAVVKPNQNLVLSKYVYLYTLSPRVTEEIRKYTVETTQANVGIASIKSFVFPLPSIPEQQNVVDELESKLTVCNKIEETISQSLQQVETLRQSILKRAFEGKLVTQKIKSTLENGSTSKSY